MECVTLGTDVTEECEIWNVRSEAQSEECEVLSVESKEQRRSVRWTIKCNVLSGECEVWNMRRCEGRSARCEACNVRRGFEVLSAE